MPDTTYVRPRGPFSLSAARDFASHWEPLSSEEGPAPLALGFRLDGDFAAVAATVDDDDRGVRIRIAGTRRIDAAVTQVQRILSLDVDATTYPDVGRREPEIGRLMAELPGLRPVLFPSPYEAAAWAVISQRISMRQAAGIQARLAASHGDVVDVAGRSVAVFPHPSRLVDETAIPGLPVVKVDRLRGIARAALDGRLDIEHLHAMGRDEAVAALRELPGIGPFWASGIYLRATGVVDVFPDEPMAIAALSALYGLRDDAPARDVHEVAARFAPWRMWVCVLLRVAANRQLIPGLTGGRG
ncbi:MAG: HhH-GPD family protein [Frankiales bacterium]|nr:HhH-GPD family protein [Frankiales bacterium]